MFFFNMPVKCVLCFKLIVENSKTCDRRTGRIIKSIVKTTSVYVNCVVFLLFGFKPLGKGVLIIYIFIMAIFGDG